jgi:hypothetical protein
MPDSFPLHYGPAEGPLGFPVTDKQAFALEALLKALPKESAYAYRKAIVADAPTEISPGERADVSWISTEDPDRTGDVVRARGMNDGQFRLNPIVTLNHAYWAPPVGRSLWRKVARDGSLAGVKAKTQYPVRPAAWQGDWPADVAFALVQADLLRGKSIGFLPTKVHAPDDREREQHGWAKVGLVIDEWVLLEYACVFLPAQQNAVVESVGKELPDIPETVEKALGIAWRGPVPYRQTPAAPEDRAWDADAALARLRQWAGIDGDQPDWSNYRQAFAYFSGAGDKAEDYKLPHHDVIDGQLQLVFKGVAAALAAVNGARGGVHFERASDRDKVYDHLARHYRDFGRQPPEPKAALVPFVTLRSVEAAVGRRLAEVDPLAIAERIAQDRLDRFRGRV